MEDTEMLDLLSYDWVAWLDPDTGRTVIVAENSSS
jgi:hypothetical protein